MDDFVLVLNGRGPPPGLLRGDLRSDLEAIEIESGATRIEAVGAELIEDLSEGELDGG